MDTHKVLISILFSYFYRIKMAFIIFPFILVLSIHDMENLAQDRSFPDKRKKEKL